MFLKLKLIGNLLILAILDAAILIGSYQLVKDFDLLSFAILLAAFGVGFSVVLKTIGIIKQLRYQRDTGGMSIHSHVDYCEQCCEVSIDCTCDTDDFGYICNGECGDDCCQNSDNDCCRDKE